MLTLEELNELFKYKSKLQDDCVHFSMQHKRKSDNGQYNVYELPDLNRRRCIACNKILPPWYSPVYCSNECARNDA